MKLQKIAFDSYKNLAKKFSFEQANKFIALIGLNGSGKSNLLEAISLVFSHIMGVKTKSFPFHQYSITYTIKGHQVDINEGVSLNNRSIPEDDIPTSVIACYSGEDNRLWDSGFKDYYIDFFNKAIKGGEYKPHVLYINKYCWKIAFVSLLFSENDAVKRFITDKLKVNHKTITIQFKTKENANPQPHDASNWYKRVETKYSGAEIPINDLINNEDVELLCEKYPNLTNDQIVFYYLYFLYMPDKRGTLGLEADKIIESIDIKLNGLNFEDLSEGEKKLILIECITRVLGDENSLLLLDEPDAHTHIAMKKDLLKLISEFEGQTIMTTHSPMFLNKRWDGFDENNVFYMHDGKIESTEPLMHLSELTDNEIDYFEGSFILSSKNILVTEGPYDILYLKHAIDIFADENSNYTKIRDHVAFMHAGGANNALALYQQTLYPFINKIENLVFIFDYDKEGFEGAEKLKEFMISNNDTKPALLFYQNDYSTLKTRKPIDKDTESYIAEDLFDSNSYINVTNKIHVNSHKELRNMTWNDIITSNKRPKGTTDAIKYYIQDNYASFGKEWLHNFKPFLDKLLDIFDLN